MRWYGSGRDTVEMRPKLSVFWLNKNGYIRRSEKMGPVGNVRSCVHEPSGEHFRIFFLLNLAAKEPDMMISSSGSDVAQRITMANISCHLGGHRWFFICPGCDSRVVNLYPHRNLFLCRTCAHLTYWQCQENKRLRKYPYNLIRSIRKLEKEPRLTRWQYAGKPTRRYRRFLRLTKGATQEEVNKAEYILEAKIWK